MLYTMYCDIVHVYAIVHVARAILWCCDLVFMVI